MWKMNNICSSVCTILTSLSLSRSRMAHSWLKPLWCHVEWTTASRWARPGLVCMLWISVKSSSWPGSQLQLKFASSGLSRAASILEWRPTQ